MKPSAVFLTALVLALLPPPQARAAELKLHPLFSDHMVLQRDKGVAVWGWADPGEEVRVRFAGQEKQAKAGPDGRWGLKLDALPASAQGRSLTISGNGSRQLEVKDVLVGEVWLGSGQSNMAMTVRGCLRYEEEMKAAELPLIRHFREASGPAEQPQSIGTKSDWQLCSAENVGGFSAALYFTGREIHRALGVPVGLINSSVGGTAIESWIAAEVQCSNPLTKASYDSRLAAYKAFDPANSKALHEQQMQVWKKAVAKAKAEGEEFVTPAPKNPLAMHRLKGGPSGLFNGKIVHLAPYTLRGMLWYQGEANAAAAALYRLQLEQLITSWRKLWGEELPFAWVQLPNFTRPGEDWPRIREAMLNTLQVPNTGMAIAIDVGEARDIHPRNKQEVGRRLSLWALGKVYGQALPSVSGPLPADWRVAAGSIGVKFKHADGGLKAIGNAGLVGFEIAAEDQQWKPAQVRIEGDSIVASSPEVSQPKALRYAWKDWPEISLANGAGLPASPFRTDDWPALPPKPRKR